MRRTSVTYLLAAAGVCLYGGLTARATELSPPERRMVEAVDKGTAGDVAMLERLVDINSGTMNPRGVVAVKDVLMPRMEALGFRVRWVPMEKETGRAGDLVAEHVCAAGPGHCGRRMLLIGHMDTVFEPSSAFQRYSVVPGTEGKVATGPGVNDMKGGLVVMLAALEAMKAAGGLDGAEIRVVLSGDEERHGEPVELARRDMVEAAKKSDVALEFETGSRRNGAETISISRRSSTTWKLETKGQTGHSSGIFNERMGAGAIYEMTRILDGFRTELPEAGLTFNVGMVLGGATAERNADGTGGAATGKANVIPPVALADGDLRTLNNEQTERVEARMRAIVEKHLPKTEARIEFGEGYPAMAPTEAGHRLVRELNEVNAGLGYPAMEELDPMLRGAGDISFVAEYVPGLVGVGAMGDGAHAEGETVFLETIPRQAKRMAVLMYRMSKETSGH